MKARMRFSVAIFCVLIACLAWTPGVLATPAVAEIAADPAVAAEIAPLNGNRTIQQIAADPVVAGAIEAAWADSNAGNYTTRHEEGGWIIEDIESGNLTVIRWPSGERDSISPGPTPNPGPGKRVVGHFHTHPNPPVDEAGTKWEQGPSTADNNFANNRGLPGVVRNGAGTQFFGPGS